MSRLFNTYDAHAGDENARVFSTYLRRTPLETAHNVMLSSFVTVPLTISNIVEGVGDVDCPAFCFAEAILPANSRVRYWRLQVRMKSSATWPEITSRHAVYIVNQLGGLGYIAYDLDGSPADWGTADCYQHIQPIHIENDLMIVTAAPSDTFNVLDIGGTYAASAGPKCGDASYLRAVCEGFTVTGLTVPGAASTLVLETCISVNAE